MTGLANGIEGLAKAIISNKASPEIITNYTKIIFKNRLEVLPGIKSEDYEEYKRLKPVYADIIRTANQYYDLIFVDVNKGLDDETTREILKLSDLIVVNITQRLRLINDYIELKKEGFLAQKKNTLLLVGRYDRYSKYNSKNMARYIGEREVFTVPYSTLFFEAANEGKVADFFLSEIKKVSSKILYKLQELKMRM